MLIASGGGSSNLLEQSRKKQACGSPKAARAHTCSNIPHNSQNIPCMTDDISFQY